MTTTPRIGFFDLESDGLLDTVTRLWCGVVKDKGTGVVSAFGPDQTADLLAHLSSYDVLIGHNIVGYDLPLLKQLYGWAYKGKVVDTLLMSRTQRPNRRTPAGARSPHSVEAWGIRLGTDKVVNEVWSEYTPLILERCIQDVEITAMIFAALMDEGHGEGWGKAHQLNVKLFAHLAEQEKAGWHVDTALLDKHIRQLQRWIDMIASAINPSLPDVMDILEAKKDGDYGHLTKPYLKSGQLSSGARNFIDNSFGILDDLSIAGPFSRVVYRRLDIDKPIEIKNYLLSMGWQPEEWNYNDEGKQTTPKMSKTDAFRGVTGRVGQLIARRVQCKARMSIMQGWRASVRDDGRIPTPVVGLAATGRLRHKGVVNVPSPDTGAFYASQMRSVFTATPGWSMVGVYSKGNQARQLAARMGDEEFTEAAVTGSSDKGTDIHTLNMIKAGTGTRAKAKTFLYAFLFGAGPANIAKQLGVPVSEAKALVARYLKSMPKLEALLTDLERQWGKRAHQRFNKKRGQMQMADGWVKGLDGRRIVIDSPHKVLNYLLQSDEAIQMSHAYVMVHEEMERRGYVQGADWNMLIFYHDEVQMEGRTAAITEACADVACWAIAQSGVRLGITCPHEGDAKFGMNWKECH